MTQKKLISRIPMVVDRGAIQKYMDKNNYSLRTMAKLFGTCMPTFRRKLIGEMRFNEYDIFVLSNLGCLIFKA